MMTMKRLIFILLTGLLLNAANINCQEIFSGELKVINYSNHGICLKIFPVSCVFNGNKQDGYRYDLRAENDVGPPSDTPHYSFINGRNMNRNVFYIPPGGINYLSFMLLPKIRTSS